MWQELKSKVKFIIFDNGIELAYHEAIGGGLEANIYTAHTCASWGRSTSENTNELIRQYFPDGSDIKLVSDKQIKRVMERLNN